MLRKIIFKIVFNDICKGTYMIQHAHSIPNLTPYTIAFTPTIRDQTILWNYLQIKKPKNYVLKC